MSLQSGRILSGSKFRHAHGQQAVSADWSNSPPSGVLVPWTGYTGCQKNTYIDPLLERAHFLHLWIDGSGLENKLAQGKIEQSSLDLKTYRKYMENTYSNQLDQTWTYWPCRQRRLKKICGLDFTTHCSQTSTFQFPQAFGQEGIAAQLLTKDLSPDSSPRHPWFISCMDFTFKLPDHLEVEPARRTHLLMTWTMLRSPTHEPHRYSKVSVWCAWAMALNKIVAWNLTWNLTGLPAWSIHLVSSCYQGATLAMMCECVCDPTNLSSTEKV